jgi:hypothetical protein
VGPYTSFSEVLLVRWLLGFGHDRIHPSGFPYFALLFPNDCHLYGDERPGLPSLSRGTFLNTSFLTCQEAVTVQYQQIMITFQSSKELDLSSNLLQLYINVCSLKVSNWTCCLQFYFFTTVMNFPALEQLTVIKNIALTIYSKRATY